MDATGALNTAWLSNVELFFKDIGAAGIPGIIPTPNFYSWQNDGEYYRKVCNPGLMAPTGVLLLTEAELIALGESLGPVPSCVAGSSVEVLRFWPTSPFGAWPTNTGPDPLNPIYGPARLFDESNQGYSNAPANPDFIGWTNILSVVDQLLVRAQQEGLDVVEFDINNEIDLLNFTVLGRLIYDTRHGANVNVYQEIRARMQNRGFAPGRTTYSTVASESHIAGDDCGSVYGDSARIATLSEVTAAFAGGLIGIPFGLNNTINSLACGGTVDDDGDPSNGLFMELLPIPASPQPSVIDIHSYPCKRDGHLGPCSRSQPQIATEATAIFDGLAKDPDPSVWICDPSDPNFVSFEGCSFLKKRGHQSSTVFLGETHSNTDNSGISCENTPAAFGPPTSTVTGFNQSALAGQPTVFRPWGHLL